MAKRPLPDPELLRKLIDYQPDTGKLFWLPRAPDLFSNEHRGKEWACAVWNTKNAGNGAFTSNHGSGKRHLSGKLFGQRHLAHRVAWAIHYGVSQFGIVDHRNGDGRDNRIENLRLANAEMNMQNAHQRHDCSTGITGVDRHVDKRWGKPNWTARIQVGRRRLFLGSFDSLEDAVAARKAAERKYNFGPVHGVPSDE